MELVHPLTTIILHVDSWCFNELKAVQLHTIGHERGQFFPDAGDQVFDGAHLSPHEIHVEVEVPVVQLFDNAVFDNTAQPFGIHDKPGIRIGFTFYGYEQFKVVPITVFIGAFAEHLIIPFPCPRRVIEFMGGIKMFHSGQVHHIT